VTLILDSAICELQIKMPWKINYENSRERSQIERKE